jgi:hypothetical protein
MLDKLVVLKLTGLFVFHWIVILISLVYVFIRSSSKWDWIYFLVIGGTALSWLVVRNECVVSLMEKKIIYDNYSVGDNTTEHPSMFLYCKNMYWGSIFGLLLEVLMCYNVFIMLQIYNSPNWLIAIVMGVYIMLITHDRIDYVNTTMRVWYNPSMPL